MSVVGKLLERILSDKIYSHLEENGLIRASLHGLVHGRSSTKFVEDVSNVINEWWMLSTWILIKLLIKSPIVD